MDLDQFPHLIHSMDQMPGAGDSKYDSSVSHQSNLYFPYSVQQSNISSIAADFLHQSNSTMSPHNASSLPSDASNDVLSNLLPALVEVFGIILIGYLAGRLNFITNTQGKGLGVFVSKFAMPALLFKNMVQLSWQDVNWLFFLSIFIGKTVVFALTAIFTLLLIRPTNFGKMGIYGIFVTQSHDLALGIPIVQALYRGSHDNFLQYLYLIAPISVAFLNPIGFLFMEIQKSRDSAGSENARSKWRTMGTVVYGVVTNPIVFMTVLGIIGNFAFKQKVPYVLDSILTVIGDAFASTALFCLGLSMVGQMKAREGAGFLTPALLIAAKMLLTPFLIRSIVTSLDVGYNTTVTTDYSTYGFIYGMFPTAPTVYIYASLYNIEAQLMAAGMVVSTFIAAPLLFISGKMLSIPSSSAENYTALVNKTAFDCSILTLVCCIWVYVVFALNKRWRGIPQRFTCWLMMSQMMMGVGLLLYHYLDLTSTWQQVLHFVLFFVGVMSSRCWMTSLAWVLCMLRRRSVCYVKRHAILFWLYGFGFPILVCSGLLMAGEFLHVKLSNDISFMYGMVQRIFVAVTIGINIILTITALVITHRHDIRLRQDTTESESTDSETPNETTSVPASPSSRPATQTITQRRPLHGQDNVSCSAPARAEIPPSLIRPAQPSTEPSTEASGYSQRRRSRPKRQRKVTKIKANCDECTSGCANAASTDVPAVTNIEDLVPDVLLRNRRRYDSTASRDSDLLSDGLVSDDEPILPETEVHCPVLTEGTAPRYMNCDARNSVEVVTSLEEQLLMQDRDEFQYTRHVLLILMMLASSFVGLSLAGWRLMMDAETGVYVEIEILDCVLAYGQGLLTFAMFGLDSELMIEPVVKWFRRWRYGVDKVHLQAWAELDFQTQLTCEQFVMYHRDTCADTIVKQCCRRQLRTYRQVFIGVEFVDWLLEVGLVNDRSDAVTYGQRLVEGAVIEHVDQVHHFYDQHYLYQFVSQRSNRSSPSTMNLQQSSEEIA